MMLLEQVRETRWFRIAWQAAAGLGAVLLIVLAIWAWYSSQESRGLAALAEANALVQQAERPENRDRAIKALEIVIAEHPRLSALPQAAYELGNLKYAAGQYAAARGAYELALAKGANGALRTLSAFGIGYTFEAEKNYAAAAKAHGDALQGLTPKDFMYEDIAMAQARDEELAGKPAAALEIYERLLRDSPAGRRAEAVRSRIASLQSRSAK